MDKEELREWVDVQREDGFSDEEIKKFLRQQGYGQFEIEEALKSESRLKTVLESSGLKWIGILGILLFLSFSALSLYNFLNDTGPDLKELNSEPESYVGSHVTVTGKMKKMASRKGTDVYGVTRDGAAGILHCVS